MSDFMPVELIKGDVEFTAHTPTQLCNALYGGGFKRKPAPEPEPTAEAVEPADGLNILTDTDDKPATRRRARATTTPEETA